MAMAPTTEAMVRKAQAGDSESREALAYAWLPSVYGVALACTGRAADAEDLTQEAFYRAFGKLHSLRDPARFGPWISQIVRNAARDLRRRPKPPTALGEAQEHLPERSHIDTRSEADATGAVKAWQGLAEDQRLVCWLKVMQGMPFREIANLLGSSKSAVYRLYGKGLAQLRKDMSRC